MICFLVIFWLVLKFEFLLLIWNKAVSDNGRLLVDVVNGVFLFFGIGISIILVFTNLLMMIEGRMFFLFFSIWFGRMCRVLVGIWIV